ncbi:hypothetical protein PMAYCL1PPCAC_06158, partial [Pristionchus mayeri]
ITSSSVMAIIMAHFTEQQALYFLVFFLISLLSICLVVWMTCMCLDWRRRRGTKSVVTLALAEGEVALASSGKLTGLRATKEATRYHETIVAIAFALYSYVSAVITRMSGSQHHTSLASFANTLHDAARSLKSGGVPYSASLLDRVSDQLDSSRVGVLRTPRPAAPPPAPPLSRTSIDRTTRLQSDIPTSSVRMTFIDEFTDEEDDRPMMPVRGIPV